MNKGIDAAVMFGLILASFYPVDAQQPAKVRKIGFLVSSTDPRVRPRFLKHSVRACVSLATPKARISLLNTDLQKEEPSWLR